MLCNGCDSSHSCPETVYNMNVAPLIMMSVFQQILLMLNFLLALNRFNQEKEKILNSIKCPLCIIVETLEVDFHNLIV